MKEIKKEAEKAKKMAETVRKLDTAGRELKRKEGYLEKDVKQGLNTSRNALEVKYAAKRVESLQKELDKLH